MQNGHSNLTEVVSQLCCLLRWLVLYKVSVKSRLYLLKCISWVHIADNQGD